MSFGEAMARESIPLATGCKHSILLAVALGWNLAVTAAWLSEKDAEASVPACPGLRRELDDTRRELERKEGQLKALAARMRSLAQNNIRAVEKALTGTGLTIEGLIRPPRGGQGGPFVPAPHDLPEPVLRWETLSRALAVLPLASPLAGSTVSSGFGKRRDPVNRRRAMHEGIDFTAPLRSPVMATGPGAVVFAGTRGGYGRLVEIDHGLGVVTRYAHLARIHVRVGQRVDGGQRIGLLGSSGRSTGPHLHYEVVVDGKARNPDRFLDAGRTLAVERH